MKSSSIKKWTLRILVTIIVVSIISCLGIKSQLKHSSGGNTEIVDSSKFKVSNVPLAIANISVLSADCSKMIDSLTVLVRDGQIVSLEKDSETPNGYQLIDGTGQYLIPGLVDTHVHLKNSKNDLLLYLANGITHVCEMFGNEKHLEWRKEANEGALSPKIYVATRKLGSKKGVMPEIRSWFGSMKNYSNPTKARQAVRKFKEQGYDAIKLSTFLEAPIYNVIVDEAKKQNIPAIGHLTNEIGLEGLYTSGQSQLAHIEEITKSTMEAFGGLGYENTDEYLTYLKENCNAIAVRIRESNIVVSSTIWLMESLPKQKFDLDKFIKTIALEYTNPGQIEGSRMSKGWLPGNNFYENLDIKNNPAENEKSQLFWKTYVEAIHIMTKALADNNVTIIAGTDANTTCTVPGFSLHDELESLHNSGMTNAQVLYSTTVAPAEWMQTNSGRIEAGYDADLVLLENNPLENINNTRTINAVIRNGKLIDKQQLDAILLSIKEANNRTRNLSIDKFIN